MWRRSSLSMPAWVLKPDAYATLTLHRPANVERPEKLAEISGRYSRRPAADADHIPGASAQAGRELPNSRWGDRFVDSPGKHGIFLTDPLGYIEFLSLNSRAKLVLTDSGGLQEETTILGIPCITLRREHRASDHHRGRYQPSRRHGPCGHSGGDRRGTDLAHETLPDGRKNGRQGSGADRRNHSACGALGRARFNQAVPLLPSALHPSSTRTNESCHAGRAMAYMRSIFAHPNANSAGVGRDGIFRRRDRYDACLDVGPGRRLFEYGFGEASPGCFAATRIVERTE